MALHQPRGQPIRSFEALLSPHLLDVVQSHYEFTHWSPVQESVIPLVIRSRSEASRQPRNVLVEACTGSGKTIAFVLPLLQLILNSYPDASTRSSLRGLGVILLPTRELAKQVHDVLQPFLSPLSLTSNLIVGGTSHLSDYSGTIYVATPGRLYELLQDPSRFQLRLHNCLGVVLDEADKMLSLGLGLQVRFILSRGIGLGALRTGKVWFGCFSATLMSRVRMGELVGSIGEMVGAGGRAVQVRVRVEEEGSSDVSRTRKLKRRKKRLGDEGEDDDDDDDDEEEEEGEGEVDTDDTDGVVQHQRSVPVDLLNSYILCPRSLKVPILMSLLTTRSLPPKAILFCLTCSDVDFFGRILSRLLPSTLPTFLLHGKMVQKRRHRTFQSFIDSPVGLLIATDVAARGLDVLDVSMILQLDAPTSPEVFVHRVGRTARMGRGGESLVLLDESEREFVGLMESKGVPLRERSRIDVIPSNFNLDEFVNRLREMNQAERDLFERSEKAFAAFVHSYKKHLCRSIFRMSQLNFDELALQYGLLRRPPTREDRLYRFSATTFENFQSIDFDAIAFKDTRREAARQTRMAARERERVEEQATVAQRRKKGRRQRQQQRQREGNSTSISDLHHAKRRLRKEKSRTHSKQRLEEYQRLEYREMREEQRLERQLKRGKITEEEYERLTGEDRFRDMFEREFNWMDQTSTRKKRKRRAKKPKFRRRKRRKTGRLPGQEVEVNE